MPFLLTSKCFCFHVRQQINIEMRSTFATSKSFSVSFAPEFFCTAQYSIMFKNFSNYEMCFFGITKLNFQLVTFNSFIVMYDWTVYTPSLVSWLDRSGQRHPRIVGHFKAHRHVQASHKWCESRRLYRANTTRMST